jgi:hypothetical protein
MVRQPGRWKHRRLVAIVVLVVGHAAGAGFYVNWKTQPSLISGPMVQIPEPDGLTIVWEMDGSFARGAVRLLGPGGAELIEPATVAGQRYEASFQGLERGAEYHYSVLNYGFLGREIVVAGPFPASTAAEPGRPFRFVAFGDSGTGSLSQAALAERIVDAAPDLVIHTGDLVYPGGAKEDYLFNFYEPNAGLIPSVPFMPILGNHDCVTDLGRPLLEAFVLPVNGPTGIELERNYWFDFGDARFVGLDSNKMSEKHSGVLTLEQMKTVVAPWLRGVLMDCDAKWKFVYFHHPFYTGSEHPAEGAAYLKEAYVSVFEECGVDMAFAGHNHLYERTAPIKGDQIVAEGAGVVYVTTGAGGAARYAMNEPPPEYMVAYNDEFLSFTQVDVLADRLELAQIDDQGRVLDEYTIQKMPGTAAGADGQGI